MTIRRKATSWERIRRFFNDVHLWLGLSSGLVLILVCFSGTVYVFNTELSEMATPHLYEVKAAAGQSRIDPESLISMVQESSGGRVTSINISNDLTRTYQFNVKIPGDKSRGGTGYMVNPYTGEIAGTTAEKSGTKEFMRTMFSLHRWLLLDKIEKPLITGMTNRELGSLITGWATIFFTIGCLTGLIIWFPKKIRNWKQGLKIKFRANWKRVNHDLHYSLAFYSLIILLLMGLTGPQWSFPWYREGLQKTLGTYKPKGSPEPEKLYSKQPAAGSLSANIPLVTFINKSDEVLSFKGDYTIILPADSSGVMGVNKYHSGFFASPAPDRLVFDQYSGILLDKDIFSERPFNQRLAGSIKALHVGNVYGTFSKILYFIACLIATSLPVTGTLIWLNKLKKKKRIVSPIVKTPRREMAEA